MNLSFIKLDINILDDHKIKLIRKYPDGDKLIVLWLGLLCLAMKSENPGYIYITNDIPYTDEDLATILDLDIKVIQMGLEVFKKFKMIETVHGGIIEIINFNKHQKLDKIERSKEISRESSKKYREKQKKLLESDGHVTSSDETDIDKDKDNRIDKEQIDTLYSLYPSRCVVSNRSTGKSSRNKDKIKALLKTSTFDKIKRAIEWYQEDCKKTETFMKNFSTFLNNIPDVEEQKKEDNSEYERLKEKDKMNEKLKVLKGVIY